MNVVDNSREIVKASPHLRDLITVPGRGWHYRGGRFIGAIALIFPGPVTVRRSREG